jgi:hypothetical protein
MPKLCYLTSHRGGPGSHTDSMWGLWWTKRHWGRFSPSTSVSPANHSTDFSIIIITWGWHSRPSKWPQCRVDRDSTPHYAKLKKKKKILCYLMWLNSQFHFEFITCQLKYLSNSSRLLTVLHVQYLMLISMQQVLRRTNVIEACHRIFYNDMLIVWSLTSFSKSV